MECLTSFFKILDNIMCALQGSTSHYVQHLFIYYVF